MQHTNELISSQRVQKRRAPMRPSRPNGRQSSAAPARIGMRPRLRGLAASIYGAVRRPAFYRSSAAVLLAAAAAALALAYGISLQRGARVSALLHAKDDLLESEMRSFVGLCRAAAADSAADADLASLDLVETFKFESYTVQRGDTLSSIALKHSLDIGSLIASNGISNAKNLQAGTSLKIPNMDGVLYTVRPGDSLSKIASANGIPMEAILDANDMQSETIHPGMKLFLPGARMNSWDLRKALGDLFIYPIRGRLTSPFGWRSDPFTGVRRFHAAIDLAAPEGTPIKATMEGRVAATGYNSVYGKYVILTHPSGYQSWYAHLSAYRTTKGAAVKQGQVIGEVGSTGYSTGNHVHFAVFKNGRALNPLSLLSKR